MDRAVVGAAPLDGAPYGGRRPVRHHQSARHAAALGNRRTGLHEQVRGHVGKLGVAVYRDAAAVFFDAAASEHAAFRHQRAAFELNRRTTGVDAYRAHARRRSEIGGEIADGRIVQRQIPLVDIDAPLALRLAVFALVEPAEHDAVGLGPVAAVARSVEDKLRLARNAEQRQASDAAFVHREHARIDAGSRRDGDALVACHLHLVLQRIRRHVHLNHAPAGRDHAVDGLLQARKPAHAHQGADILRRTRFFGRGGIGRLGHVGAIRLRAVRGVCFPVGRIRSARRIFGRVGRDARIGRGGIVAERGSRIFCRLGCRIVGGRSACGERPIMREARFGGLR